MSFSSYMPCGLEPASLFGDDGDDKSSSFSFIDYMRDLPLCCPCPIDSKEPPSDREAITQGIMMNVWRPPLYRDKSLLANSSCPSVEDKRSSPSSKIITPSVGIVSCDHSIFSRDVQRPQSIKTDPNSLPVDFIPPKHLFLLSFDAKKHVESTESFTGSSSGLRLQHQDVVCGRGAATSTHPGNLTFQKIIKKHEMEYVCSKRNEKPKIARKLLAKFHSHGVRFVRREIDEEGSFVWVEIGEQREFEKVCQSLREDAPRLRRKMMATEAFRSTRAEKQHQSQNQVRQCRQDLNTNFAGETSNGYDGRHQPSFATNKNSWSHESHHILNIQRLHHEKGVSKDNNTNFAGETSNGYDGRHQPSFATNRNSWSHESHHDEGVSKDNHYNMSKYNDTPYYMHLPPHLGGERLFGDRVFRE